MLRYLLFSMALVSVFATAKSTGTSYSPLMCIDHYPPLQIIHKDGHVTGENVEVARAFFKSAGFELRFTDDVPFKRCLQWLKEGKVDVVAGLIYTSERAQQFNLFKCTKRGWLEIHRCKNMTFWLHFSKHIYTRVSIISWQCYYIIVIWVKILGFYWYK